MVTGFLYYAYATRSFKRQIGQELTAIADLKSHEINHWRKDRLGDVSIFHHNKAFSALVKRYFEHPDDRDNAEQLYIWLDNVRGHENYKHVYLLDTNAGERLTIPYSGRPVSSFLVNSCNEIFKSREVVFQDFYRNEFDRKIYLDVLTPLFDEQDTMRILGVLGFQIDPGFLLYPFISSWPTPSKSSETIILRREGDEVVFLNNLKVLGRCGPEPACPVDGKKANPAIKAVSGETGIVEGADYRGVFVIADIRPIKDSPWFMVSRMDQSEAFAPLNEILWVLAILAALLFGMITFGFVLFWKQRRLPFYREKSETTKNLRESEERYTSMIQTSQDGFWVTDKTGRLLEVNDA